MNPVFLWDAILERAYLTWPYFIVELWLRRPIRPAEIDADGQLICSVEPRFLRFIGLRYGPWLGQVVRELGAEGLVLRPAEDDQEVLAA